MTTSTTNRKPSTTTAVPPGPDHRDLTGLDEPRPAPQTHSRGGHQGSPATPAVGDAIALGGTRWSFAGSASTHFDTHVNKSVPLYDEGHRLIETAVDFFLRPGGRLVDLGCSTGTLLHRLATRNGDESARFVGVDIERDMVQVARKRCAEHRNVEIHLGDAVSVDYADTDVVIMYYTLQFLPPAQRPLVLRRVCDGLREGGALFLFEKVLAPDARIQDLIGQLYMDFKVDQGFNLEEIFGKARSLRGVLEPQTSDSNHSTLAEVGFRSVATVQRYLNFEGILAVR